MAQVVVLEVAAQPAQDNTAAAAGTELVVRRSTCFVAAAFAVAQPLQDTAAATADSAVSRTASDLALNNEVKAEADSEPDSYLTSVDLARSGRPASLERRSKERAILRTHPPIARHASRARLPRE